MFGSNDNGTDESFDSELNPESANNVISPSSS
jgi:hypothetical protein